jgi:hypothetical protein
MDLYSEAKKQARSKSFNCSSAKKKQSVNLNKKIDFDTKD